MVLSLLHTFLLGSKGTGEEMKKRQTRDCDGEATQLNREVGSSQTAEQGGREAVPLHTAEQGSGFLVHCRIQEEQSVSAEEQSSGHKHPRIESCGGQFVYAL